MTLTLSQNAAEDIGGVINAIADLLKIAVPPSYEISRSPSPEQIHKVPAIKKKLYSSGMYTVKYYTFAHVVLHGVQQNTPLPGEWPWEGCILLHTLPGSVYTP